MAFDSNGRTIPVPVYVPPPLAPPQHVTPQDIPPPPTISNLPPQESGDLANDVAYLKAEAAQLVKRMEALERVNPIPSA